MQFGLLSTHSRLHGSKSYRDMQYMLGDSLLVAPVFREDNEVEYYLPEGR